MREAEGFKDIAGIIFSFLLLLINPLKETKMNKEFILLTVAVQQKPDIGGFFKSQTSTVVQKELKLLKTFQILSLLSLQY